MGNIEERKRETAETTTSLMLVLATGYVICSAFPISYGALLWLSNYISYGASFPTDPNIFSSGTGDLDAFRLMFFVGPIYGTIGASMCALCLWVNSVVRD